MSIKFVIFAFREAPMITENPKRFARKIQELTALYEISHSMASILDFKSVLNQDLR